MGIDWGDFKNDGTLGLAIGNFANEMTALYVTDDPKTMLFSDLANIFGLGAPTQPPLKFGLFFFDYDLDGRLDLLTANGHLESDIALTQASETYAQSAQLFWNTGSPGREMFVLVGEKKVGPDLLPTDRRPRELPTPTSTAMATSTSSSPRTAAPPTSSGTTGGTRTAGSGSNSRGWGRTATRSGRR